MYFDSYYLLLVVPALLISMWAQFKVKSTFSRFEGMRNANGKTAYDIARLILDKNGLQHIQIERVRGKLTDHYDPKNNVIRLSDNVFNSCSVSAIGVAAHEVGHAIQYSVGYSPIKIRAALIPITQIGSSAALPLALFGIFMGISWLTTIGIVLFTAVVIFQLITLPVEFNASSRALKTLENDMILQGDELNGAKKVLSAAAMTYVAAVIVAFANLFRLLLIRNRND